MVELVERRQPETINPGELEPIEIYRVRWPMPNGPDVTDEVAGDALKALPAAGRHGGPPPDSA